ncbi:MAG: methionine--tRNA ligase [Ignavibacteria bacterium]|nr:methionine--tRNA ligase [Ignavibacteria bacterium]
MSKKRYLVTAALPYANGYLHLGHIAGAYLPSDIYVRYRRLKGDDVVFICGSDEHGTAIEISAINEKVTPKEIIDKYHFSNKESFERLGIKFDIYSRTSEPLHIKTSQEFFLNLYNKGILKEKKSKQLYSEKDKMFLADRYVIGTCPVCGNEEANGDQCENCGSDLSPLDLKNPRSKISGDIPVVKETSNFVFPFKDYQGKLEQWIDTKKDWKANVINYCKGWFKTGLQDRDYTRDLNWGVPVPLEGYDGKVIYVWFEAPIGYISFTKELFEKRVEPDKWKDYWCDKETNLIHFIGKDNIIFHALIFPAMIMAHGDYILPDNVPANEFLNFGGGKFSKSKGVGSALKDYLNEYDADLIRYCLATTFPENKDSEFSLDDFVNKNNNELAAILGNYINRTVVFAKSKFDNKVPARSNDISGILEEIKALANTAAGLFENYKLKDGLTEVMNIVRAANKYFNDSEPWKVIKTDKEKCGEIINDCLQICHSIAIAISPVLPYTAEKILKVLNKGNEDFSWDKIGKMVLNAGDSLGENEILFPILEKKAEEPEIKEELNLISIDDFKKVTLKVGEVIEAEKVANSKKLLKLKIKVGDKEKQIVSGISEHYSAESLIGKSIVIVDNLKPSKLMGIESQGMLLAAKNGKDLRIITIDGNISSGAEVS